MSAPFQPGDVVVCVDAEPLPYSVIPIRCIRVGGVYRVEAFNPKMLDRFSGECFDGVQLVGVVADTGTGWLGAYRFRKIDDDVTEDFREQMRSLGKPARHSRERVA